MMRAVPLVGLLVLCACQDATNAADDVAQRSASAAVSNTIVLFMPEVPRDAVTPVTNCVVSNSDLRELRRFAGDAVTGVDQATLALTTLVLQRPETQQCVAAAGVTALAG